MTACEAEDQMLCPDGCADLPRANAFAGQEQRGLGQVEVFDGFGWVQDARTSSPIALDESNERSFNSSMGRIAGVTAAETRARLLRAAADVFAQRGYDGTRVADIAAAAGVSNGALYAHFGSKAELLVAAIRAHGRQLLADLFAADPERPVMDLLLTVGRLLPRRSEGSCHLIVEALVAARRDEDVAGPMRDYIGERADWISGLVRTGQGGGELDPAVSPAALAHLCLLLSMGSVLITPDMHAVDDEEWTALLTRIVTVLAVPSSLSQRELS